MIIPVTNDFLRKISLITFNLVISDKKHIQSLRRLFLSGKGGMFRKTNQIFFEVLVQLFFLIFQATRERCHNLS